MNKLFAIRDIDSHYIISLLGHVVLKVKHCVKNVSMRRVETNGLDTISRNRKIIASLTTFPARISHVHIVIEQILTQTIKPDKVILWLSEREFPQKEAELPEKLLRLKDYGLSIEWCDYMCSYQKLVPSMMAYPDDIIITFDDDFYYPENMIEDLYLAYLKNPTYIQSNRTWRGFIKNNEFYTSTTNKMFENVYPEPSYFNLLMGYGVVLYPPHSLDPMFCKKDMFMSIIPTHDDVWFWAMAVLAGTKTCQNKGFNFSIISVEDTQKVALSKVNHKHSTSGMDTDEAYQKIISAFPKIWTILKGVQ